MCLVNVLILLTFGRFWTEFDPTRQMVDIRLGGIIPRTPAESISLKNVIKEIEPSCITERGAFQPSNGHNAEALQGWEHQAICVIDPFIRVRVSVGVHVVFSTFSRIRKERRRKHFQAGIHGLPAGVWSGGREPMKEVIRSGRKPWLCP